jgi:ribosomal protein S18 acetylase RimI-like enzyme
LNVRPATLDDTPVLTFLRDERYVLLQQSAPRLQVSPTRLDFPAVLNIPQVRVFVATGEDNERVAGYIAVALSPLSMTTAPATPETGFLLELALDAHRYHAGMGRALYRTAAGWLQTQGKSSCLIAVPHFYVVEQAFWRSLGAEVVEAVQTPSRGWGWMKLPL